MDSSHFCLLPVQHSPVPEHTEPESGVNRGRWRGVNTQTKPIQTISSPSGSPGMSDVLSGLVSLHISQAAE